VIAHQFAKRGIVNDRVREQALRIIDIAILSKLGMKPQDLSRRRQILAELRARPTARSEVVKALPALKKPQVFLMEVCEVFVYPTTGGGCINSYFRSKEEISSWNQDGWGRWSWSSVTAPSIPRLVPALDDLACASEQAFTCATVLGGAVGPEAARDVLAGPFQAIGAGENRRSSDRSRQIPAFISPDAVRDKSGDR
jgi:hypothetical protein